MKICWQGFLQGTHSWGIVGQNLCRSLMKDGHQVDMFATQGINNFPHDLKDKLIGYVDPTTNTIVGNQLTETYDMQLSYTAMRNFQPYFSHGTQNRFGIWAYEWKYLPSGWAKQHNFVDKILVPNYTTKKNFIENGVPENKIVILRHGVDPTTFNNKNKYKINTNKSIKIFCNIGQAHMRKNIDGMFTAFLRAFDKNSDVCLVAKIHKPKAQQQAFEVNPIKILNDVRSRFRNAPEIHLITDYVNDITELYNACDIVYSIPHTECFYIPGLEAIFADKINIVSNFTREDQIKIEYLSETNPILVDGKMKRAPLEEQYWSSNAVNEHFQPDINDAIDKLKYVYSNFDKVNREHKNNYDDIKKNYTWDAVKNDLLCIK